MAALNLSDLPLHSEGVGEKCLVIGKFSILVVTPGGGVAGPPTSVFRYPEPHRDSDI